MCARRTLGILVLSMGRTDQGLIVSPNRLTAAVWPCSGNLAPSTEKDTGKAYVERTKGQMDELKEQSAHQQ